MQTATPTTHAIPQRTTAIYVPFGRAVESYDAVLDSRRRKMATAERKAQAKALPVTKPVTVAAYAPLPDYGDWGAEQYTPTPMSMMVREPIRSESDWCACAVAIGDFIPALGIAQRDNGGFVIDGRPMYPKTVPPYNPFVNDKPTNKGEAFYKKVASYTGKPQTGHDNHYRNLMLAAGGL